MNKDREWVFMKLGKMFPSHSEIHDYSDNITVTKREILNQVYDILSQLDVPEALPQELPVIPKFVSEWIEETKEKGYPLAYAINSSKGELGEWLHNCDTDIETEENQEVFAEAWMGGYEIEKEPLYYAMVKGHELLDDVAKYWAQNKYDLEDLFISYETRDDSPIVVKNTKKHWNDLSINDSNADFVRVEEVE